MEAIKGIFASLFSQKNMKMLEKVSKQAFDIAKEKSVVLMKAAQQQGKELAKKAEEAKKEAAKKAAKTAKKDEKKK